MLGKKINLTSGLVLLLFSHAGFGASITTSYQAIDKEIATVKTYDLTDINKECLRYSVADEADAYLIRVRKLNDESCGGDPNIEPTLFFIRITKDDGKTTTTAHSIDGSFRQPDYAGPDLSDDQISDHANKKPIKTDSPLCGVLTDAGYSPSLTFLVPHDKSSHAVIRYEAIDDTRGPTPMEINKNWWICVTKGDILKHPKESDPFDYGTIRIEEYQSDETTGEKGME
jgi:hypothetical protein